MTLHLTARDRHDTCPALVALTLTTAPEIIRAATNLGLNASLAADRGGFSAFGLDVIVTGGDDAGHDRSALSRHCNAQGWSRGGTDDGRTLRLTPRGVGGLDPQRQLAGLVGWNGPALNPAAGDARAL